MPNHYLKLDVLKLHLVVMYDSQSESCILAKNAGKFKRRVYDSETAYLFEPVNNTNLFLKISDL